MDAITYFFFNLGLLNFLLALAAFILGLILGWLLWGKFKGQIDSYINKQKGYESDINGLKSKNKDLEARLANTGDLDGLKADLDASNKAGAKLDTDLKGANQQIADLKAQLEDCKKNSAAGSSTDEELAACKRKCAELESERSGLESKIATLSAVGATAAAAPVAVAVSSSPDTDRRSTSRSFFDSALASGKMKEDAQYGLLYTSAPDEVDDLTKIKGVAGVLNGTLNEYGVYTYRQIALWTPQICEDFSERLSFKGRIERDDWIGQCKQFHQEKYGEQI